MAYKVVLSDRASEQLDSYVLYLAVRLGNTQAASNLLDDALDTSEALSYVAPPRTNVVKNRYNNNPAILGFSSFITGKVVL